MEFQYAAMLQVDESTSTYQITLLFIRIMGLHYNNDIAYKSKQSLLAFVEKKMWLFSPWLHSQITISLNGLAGKGV